MQSPLENLEGATESLMLECKEIMENTLSVLICWGIFAFIGGTMLLFQPNPKFSYAFLFAVKGLFFFPSVLYMQSYVGDY